MLLKIKFPSLEKNQTPKPHRPFTSHAFQITNIMSFSKLKRFNDLKDVAPPLGQYNPKFLSDLSSIATHAKKSGVRAASRSRPSSPAPSTITNNNRRLPSPRPSNVPILERGRSPLPAIRIDSGIPRSKPKLYMSNVSKVAAELEELNKQIAKQLQEANEEKTKLEKENQQLQSQLKERGEEKVEWTLKEQVACKTIADREESIANLQSQIKAYELAVDKLKSADKSEQNMKKTIEGMQNSLDEMANLIATKDEHISEITNLLHIHEATNRFLETDRLESAKSLEDSAQIIGELRENIKSTNEALQQSEEKYQLLEENMTKCFHVSEDELKATKKEIEALKRREAELEESLKNGQGKVEELKVAIQAQKSINKCFEEKQEKIVNNYSKLKSDWEKKEKHYLQEIDRLQTLINTVVENPMSLTTKAAKDVINEFVEVRSSNEVLQNKITALKNEIAKEKSETLMDSMMEGLDKVTENVLSSFSDDQNANIAKESKEDIKAKIQQLKADEQEISEKSHIFTVSNENTLKIVAKFEEENEGLRKSITSINNGVFGSKIGNGSSETLSSIESDLSLGSRISNSSGILSTEKWASNLSEVNGNVRVSSSVFGTSTLAPISEEEAEEQSLDISK